MSTNQITEILSEKCQVPNSNACAEVLNLTSFSNQRQSLHCFDCCDRENVHFNSRNAYVIGEGLRIRVKAANFAGIFFFFSKHAKFACLTRLFPGNFFPILFG